MRLTRLPERVEYEHDGDRVVGVRGLLVIGPRCWPTIERGGGYVHLLPRRYVVEMARMRGSGRRALRVLAVGIEEASYPLKGTLRSLRRGRIYVHGLEDGDRVPPPIVTAAHHLEGCVGPGVQRAERGVLDGAAAMRQIFDALGGWVEGRRVELEVG